ncbi:MAG: hypothetical protein Q8S21_06845 [Candidatus Paracaedibacteraceae bacterium]|nr:hypothetical protein [Candidatus Paracaedibacteraceae bacterium]
MPQFDATTFLSQLFWLTLCLGMVVFCFARIFIPRFNSMVEKRFSKIQDNLDQAQLFDTQTRELAEKYEHELATAKQKAKEHIKVTVAEFAEKKRSQLIGLDEELSSNIKAMEKSFERKQTLMIDSMEPLAKELAQQILQHVLGQPKDFGLPDSTSKPSSVSGSQSSKKARPHANS